MTVHFKPAPLQIFCDFDGTITTRDTIVFLTERLGAGPKFRNEMLEAIKSGELTVFEVIRRELATVGAEWEEAVRILRENISVDPGFRPFVHWCRSQGYQVYVVSSGMEPVVKLFVEDLNVPIFAHEIDPRPTGWQYRRKTQHDKQRLLQQAREGGKIVFVGDGTSDVAAVPHADILFAKSYLAEYCREHDIRFHPYSDFFDVKERMATLAPEVSRAD